MRELLPGHKGVTIAGFGEHVPVDEDSYGGHTNIDSNNAVSNEDPSADEIIILSPWWLFHDVDVWWVESKSCCWWAISDQVNPKQLN